MNLERKYIGLELENKNFISILTLSENEKRKWIQDNANYGNLQLKNYDFFDLVGDVVPECGYKVEGNLFRFASFSAARLFLRPFAFTNLDKLILTNSQRLNPIVVKYPFKHIDTLIVKYPDEYRIEKPFAGYELTTQFGMYKISFQEDNDVLYFTRQLILYEGKYPQEDYKGFRDFINEVQRKDKDQIVLVKKISN